MSDARPDVVKAVILARGLGTRMRRTETQPVLAPAQAAAADAGMKGMIPIGRPFLDYILSALADAGYRQVCLVTGPEHDAIREYYTHAGEPRRVQVHFAVQDRPLGTADAVLAAKQFVGSDEFLVINSDNYYPAVALSRLREQGAPALAGFDRDTLVLDGNIPEERIGQFAVLDVAPDGSLRRIVEKPHEAMLRRTDVPPLVSMNCWLFTSDIFEACRSIPPSPRGELELPDAVQWLLEHRRTRFAVLPMHAPVLDLSSRADIPAVAARLEHVAVSP